MILRSSALEVSVLPEVGGKISQIRDIHSKRDFLVPARKPYQPIPVGSDWMQYDTSGMDDCFPNVAPGPYVFSPWSDTMLPQLGEWVYGSWETISATNREVKLGRGGRLLPYRATKAVRFIDARTVEIDYRVKNLSRFPIRYLWSAHPLFVVAQQFDIRLSNGEMLFRTFPADDENYKWPIFNSVDLSFQWVALGSTVKVFLSGLREGWCELVSDDHKIHVSFDLCTTPVLGLWFNNFGFPPSNPFRCIAVEPCTSASDLLGELEPSAYPVLEPGGTNSWWLKLEIS
jgi:hypothetical protein